jgi:hypothetical protein
MSFALIGCNANQVSETTDETTVEDTTDGTGVEIPDDYPVDDVPLIGVENSDLTSSDSDELDDYTNLSLYFQVDESYDSILSTITASYEDLSETYSDIDGDGFANINSTANGYEYAIAILAIDDDTASVTYTVYLPN